MPLRLEKMLPEPAPLIRRKRAEQHVVAEQVAGDEEDALGAAVARDRRPRRRPRSRASCGGDTARVPAARLVVDVAPAPPTTTAPPAPRPVEPRTGRRGRRSRREAIEVPAQVVEPADHEAAVPAAVRHRRRRSRRRSPGGRCRRVSTEKTLSTPSRSEVKIDPAVASPDGRLVHPGARGELRDPPCPGRAGRDWPRPAWPLGGPVGGEDEATAVGARARVEILVAVGRERLELAAREPDPVEVGHAALATARSARCSARRASSAGRAARPARGTGSGPRILFRSRSQTMRASRSP